ncbi:hypothetical protein HXX76_004194 [Chlamydomonas incerta]|uniref:Uncharacterized protein n=1 Tax=Chlamydomonas incerta TaxID=51695 RepID=A0A835W5F3_CHLIN|nr:hypothetical protein HXX76_004194 [Chlamydomonas incerta]|eukprot:KAG2440080.1 hypothetical protein HXX76_004194 [Chlamydomonas incerta]
MAMPATSSGPCSRRPQQAAWLLLALVAALVLLSGPHAGAAAAALPAWPLPRPLMAAQAHANTIGAAGGSSSSGMGRQLQQAGYTVTGSVKTPRRSFSYKASQPGLRHGRRSQQ